MFALLFLVLATPVVEASRPPDVGSAEELVDQLIDQTLSGNVRLDWMRRNMQAADLSQNEAPLARANQERLSRRLGPGGDLYRAFVRSPSIYGSVSGPDYVRVVLEGGDWTTVTVASKNGRPQIRSITASSCGLCSEPERFVTDLFAEVSKTGDASHRLLPGIELEVEPFLEARPSQRDAWIWAYVNRLAGANHNSRVLREARVEGARGSRVRVRLDSGVEDWPLVYSQERWWVDYSGLAEDSPLRLALSEVSAWTRPETVRKARLAAWRPSWRRHYDGVQISEGALFLYPRVLQEDLLIYDQDMGRRWAMWALLQPDSGQVSARLDAPRLSRRMFVDTLGWAELFRFAMSGDGRFFAVAAHSSLWLFDLEFGEVVRTQSGFAGAGALSFSPAGDMLAVLDRSLGVLKVYETSDFRLSATGRGPRDAIDMKWEAGGIWVLAKDRVAQMHAESWRVEEEFLLGCTQGSPSWGHSPGQGTLWVHCPSSRNSLIQLDAIALDEPQEVRVLSGPRKDGVFAMSSDGRWMVVPARKKQADGMCLVEARTGAEVRCFSPRPLRSAHFDSENHYLYGIDQRGRAWKWRLFDLL